MTIDDFAVFILSYKRPKEVITYKTLKRQKYTGPVYIILSSEDPTINEYKDIYGEKIIVFDKKDYKDLDKFDNSESLAGVFYPRTACYDIARNLGYKYFLALDDDYKSFVYKFDSLYRYQERPVLNLDRLFSIVLEYYKTIPARTLALAQNGDIVGGKNGGAVEKIWLKRKAMNTFFSDIDRPVRYVGRFNEDVNIYTGLGHRGELFLTLFNVAIIQKMTQQTKGGMTEMYLYSGTFIKSWYSVMQCPSFVSISGLGYLHRRIHHRIDWKSAVPRILSEEHCKRLKKSSIVE